MPELSIMEMIKYALGTLVESKVFILVILELAILLISLVFSKLMDKKVVKITSITASVLVLLFYISNYVETLKIFIDNVSTKLVELIYFPTTLEFMGIMIVSFIIMAFTLVNKKNGKLIKFINTSLPIVISFLFLCIIEYINKYNVEFNEFSVFSNPVLMSLYEIAMGLFISWILGLIIREIDLLIINSVSLPKLKVNNDNLVTVNMNALETDNDTDDLELPRLKSQI